MRAETVIGEFGGVAKVGELRREVGRYAVEQAVAAGHLTVIAPGMLSAGEPRARALARVFGGQVSHQSAAVELGLALLRKPDVVDLTLARSSSRRPAPLRVVLHRGGLEPGGELVTSALRTVQDCARTLTLPEALAIADSALRRGLVTRSELEQTAVGLRGPGSSAGRHALLAADPLSESPLESGLRGVFLVAGISGFVSQHEIWDGTDLLARADFAHPRLRIVLEADGFEFHSTPEQQAHDARRADELVARGWIVLRFTWRHVLHHPEWVVKTILAAMEQRTWELRSRR